MSEREFGETPNDWAKREVKEIGRDYFREAITHAVIEKIAENAGDRYAAQVARENKVRSLAEGLVRLVSPSLTSNEGEE